YPIVTCMLMLYFIIHLFVICYCKIVVYLFFFFFFQAEDGIRDDLVTGVQTCALPICDRFNRLIGFDGGHQFCENDRRRPNCSERSEERRVGKECRSRWWAYY